MPNTLSYNPDQSSRSAELAPRYVYTENKQEFHLAVPTPNEIDTSQKQLDDQRHIDAQTAITKEIAISYQPEAATIPESEQYRQSIGHAAVRVEWFRNEELQPNAEVLHQRDVELVG